VPLPKLQLCGVFNRHHALVARDEARKDIEQRRLACAGASRHDDVQPRLDGATQELEHRTGQRLAIDQVVSAKTVRAETANRHRRSVESQRRNDHVDAGAVFQSRIDHRRGFVDAAAHRADDTLDDLHEVLVVTEHDLRFLDATLALDVDLRRAVDEDVRDRRILKQHLQRAKAEHLVQYVLNDVLAIEQAERDPLILVIDSQRYTTTSATTSWSGLSVTRGTDSTSRREETRSTGGKR
jgi:hypothetical protein